MLQKINFINFFFPITGGLLSVEIRRKLTISDEITSGSASLGGLSQYFRNQLNYFDDISVRAQWVNWTSPCFSARLVILLPHCISGTTEIYCISGVAFFFFLVSYYSSQCIFKSKIVLFRATIIIIILKILTLSFFLHWRPLYNMGSVDIWNNSHSRSVSACVRLDLPLSGESLWRNRTRKTDSTPDVTPDSHPPRPPGGKPLRRLLVSSPAARRPSWRVSRPLSWSNPQPRSHKHTTVGKLPAEVKVDVSGCLLWHLSPSLSWKTCFFVGTTETAASVDDSKVQRFWSNLCSSIRGNIRYARYELS